MNVAVMAVVITVYPDIAGTVRYARLIACLIARPGRVAVRAYLMAK